MYELSKKSTKKEENVPLHPIYTPIYQPMYQPGIRIVVSRESKKDKKNPSKPHWDDGY